MPSITVRHNVEMGHRLSKQPDSKCFHLHGHSWWVELTIYGPLDVSSGMILEFGSVKARWRTWLDEYFDHHLLLAQDDPLVQSLKLWHGNTAEAQMREWGITKMPTAGDPTVENVAAMFHQMAAEMFGSRFKYHIELWEASTNKAEYGFRTYDQEGQHEAR